MLDYSQMSPVKFKGLNARKRHDGVFRLVHENVNGHAQTINYKPIEKKNK